MKVGFRKCCRCWKGEFSFEHVNCFFHPEYRKKNLCHSFYCVVTKYKIQTLNNETNKDPTKSIDGRSRFDRLKFIMLKMTYPSVQECYGALYCSWFWIPFPFFPLWLRWFRRFSSNISICSKELCRKIWFLVEQSAIAAIRSLWEFQSNDGRMGCLSVHFFVFFFK